MKLRRIWATATWLSPVLLGASPKETLDLFFRVQQYNEASLSPDGRRLAWIEDRPNADRTPSTNASIYLYDTAGGVARRLAGEGSALCDERGLAWSPDSGALAFLSDREVKHQLQLYVAGMADGTARKLTALSGFLQRPSWSPDGRTIALLMIAETQSAAGAVEAAERDSGEVAERFAESRLVLIDATSGQARVISPADTYVYEYDWSPDSRRLAFISAKGSGDNNWWLARLGTIDAASGAVHEIYRPAEQIAVPRWSPDGSQIAFIQGLMSDAGSTGGDIWTVPAAGGAATDLTPGRKASPAWLHWQRGTGHLIFSEVLGGGAAIGELDPSTGRTATLWQGEEYLDAGRNNEELSLALADDGTTSALVRRSFDRAPEVWLGPIGRWSPVTRANAGLKPLWGRAASIRWKSDAFTPQGWLIYPRNLEAGKRYPLAVQVHGGPAAAALPGWGGFLATALAAEGYFVFEPNPRGSFGQGEAFTRGNVRDFGYGDLRDILAGVDAVVKEAPVDPERVGICGGSYGGFMAMWAITQTHRFRASVADAGICNWQSYYGENLIDQWMIPYFGASVYDDPAAYLRCSPIAFIKAARTPTLVEVGDSDKECPAPQSYEFWHALRALGVETKLVVYANEGHWFRNPANIEDRLSRSVRWFDEHLR